MATYLSQHVSTEMNAGYFSARIVELTEHHFPGWMALLVLGNHDTRRLMSRFECKGEREGAKYDADASALPADELRSFITMIGTGHRKKG